MTERNQNNYHPTYLDQQLNRRQLLHIGAGAAEAAAGIAGKNLGGQSEIAKIIFEAWIKCGALSAIAACKGIKNPFKWGHITGSALQLLENFYTLKSPGTK